MALDLDTRGSCFQQQDFGIKIWTQPFFKAEDNLSIFFIDVQGLTDDDTFFANFVWLLSFFMGSVVFYSTKSDFQ